MFSGNWGLQLGLPQHTANDFPWTINILPAAAQDRPVPLLVTEAGGLAWHFNCETTRSSSDSKGTKPLQLAFFFRLIFEKARF